MYAGVRSAAGCAGAPRAGLYFSSRVRSYRTAGFGALLVAAGCFEPSYPVGLLCSPRGECPGDQVCVNDICIRPNAQPMSDGGAPDDGSPPVYYDATPCVPITADDATCDGRDDDCDDAFDEDAGSQIRWYRDHDGDGFGLTAESVFACARPEGHSETAGDCWDSPVDPRSRDANPDQGGFQDGVMAESTTGLFGDWNCDGMETYEEIQCAIESGIEHPACEYAYDGWVNTFPECGESRQFCTSWDYYDHFCQTSELRAQRCY